MVIIKDNKKNKLYIRFNNKSNNVNLKSVVEYKKSTKLKELRDVGIQTLPSLFKIKNYILLLILMFGLTACQSPPVQVDFKNIPEVNTPNYYLVCPENYCNIKPNLISPVYKVSINKLDYYWQKMVSAQPRIKVLATNNKSFQYTYIQTTKILGFPDTINVKLISLGDEQSSLAIYSKSKYGYSDLGVNKKRVTTWLNELQKQASNQIKPF